MLWISLKIVFEFFFEIIHTKICFHLVHFLVHFLSLLNVLIYHKTIFQDIGWISLCGTIQKVLRKFSSGARLRMGTVLTFFLAFCSTYITTLKDSLNTIRIIECVIFCLSIWQFLLWANSWLQEFINGVRCSNNLNNKLI